MNEGLTKEDFVLLDEILTKANELQKTKIAEHINKILENDYVTARKW